MDKYFAPMNKPQFVGNARTDAVLVPLDDGYLTQGYIADSTGNIRFGAVCMVINGTNKVKAGVADSMAKVAGVAVFNPATAQNRPSYGDGYIAEMPVDILSDGYCWYHTTKPITREYGVYAYNSTGIVTFSETAVTGATLIKWMKIALIDEKKKRVLVKVDVYAEEGAGGGDDTVAQWAIEGTSDKIPMNKVTGLSDNGTYTEVGEHDDEGVILHGNAAYLGEPTESKDNMLVTKDLLDAINTELDSLDARIKALEDKG